MPRFTLTERIAAPPAEVFEIFADLERAPERIKGIARLEVLTPGPVGAGTRFRETRVMFGREHSEEMQVTEFNAPHSYEVTCRSCGMEYQTVFRFVPDGGGTRVEQDFSTRPLSLGARLMAPLGFLMMGSMKKCMQDDLTDLKRAAEGAPAAT